jgi:NADH-quinone oxidoreductase subunit A
MERIDTSNLLSPWTVGSLSLICYAVAVFVLMGLIMFLTVWPGAKSKNTNKQRPYESGIIPTGSARLRYPVPFFLMAIFFLIFDVEGAFIFSWAVAAKLIGWTGWFQMSFFIFILLFGLVYIWRKRGIVWEIKSKTK